MTRLRVTCRNTELVDRDQIKAFEGVLGLINEGDYYQIILGPGKAKSNRYLCWRIRLTKRCGIDRLAGKTRLKSKVSRNKSKIKKTAWRWLLKSLFHWFLLLSQPAYGFGSLDRSINERWCYCRQAMDNDSIVIQSLDRRRLLATSQSILEFVQLKYSGATLVLGGMIRAISIGGNIVEISKWSVLYNEAIPLESILTTAKAEYHRCHFRCLGTFQNWKRISVNVYLMF